MSGVIVSVASYFLFKEKLQITQIIGMVIIIAGATLIAMFPAEDATTGNKASSGEIMIVLIFSLCATCFLSLEIVLSKTLARRGVDGKYVGLNFLMAVGILGTVCLIFAAIFTDTV